MLLFYSDKKTYLLCRPYSIIKLDTFYNSIEIGDPSKNVNEFEMFDIMTLINPETYEMQIAENKMFIICNTLNVSNILR